MKTGKFSSDNLIAVRPIQRVLVGVIFLLLFGLIVGRFIESQQTQIHNEINAKEAAENYEMSVTINESTHYFVEYGRWLNGEVTRRNLQIRRALLAQRLAVKDATEVPTGERVSPEYLQALAELDLLVFSAQSGFLSDVNKVGLKNSSQPILARFVAEVRALDKQLLEIQDSLRDDHEADDRHHTISFYYLTTTNLLVLACGLILAFSRTRDYRKARNLILVDHEQLLATRGALERSRNEAQQQIAIEEAHREEILRLDAVALTILSKMREAGDKRQVIEILSTGVCTSIGADYVIFNSFASANDSEAISTWPNNALSSVEKKLFSSYQEQLREFITEIQNGPGILTISDMNLITLTEETARIPELFNLITRITRSYITVPLVEGSVVFGFVSAMMRSEAREWTISETTFIQRLASNAIHTMLHFRSIEQLNMIAEQDVAVSRLKEIDATKTKFIANVSHELRTPLTSIIGYLEVITESDDSGFEPEIANALKVVMRNARRLQSLVNNTLFITTLEGRRTEFDPKPVDLAMVLRNLMESQEPMAKNGDVTLKLVIKNENESLRMECNGAQIEQLFTNLVSNAIKFTPHNGTVTVTAQRIDAEKNGVIEVTVRDTGIGIPADEMEKLFQRFSRGSNAMTAMIPGTGLGLTIVKDIVDIHHGSVTVASTVGEGTVFTVRLPVTEDSPVQL